MSNDFFGRRCITQNPQVFLCIVSVLTRPDRTMECNQSGFLEDRIVQSRNVTVSDEYFWVVFYEIPIDGGLQSGSPVTSSHTPNPFDRIISPGLMKIC